MNAPAHGAARLIVNADDLGWSRGINEGIFHAHRHGIVTSATLVANMPAAEAALAVLKEVPNLGVGVHLNACQGRPLSPGGAGVLAGRDGVMASTAGGMILRCALRPRRMRRAIAEEFDAQVRWCLDAGLKPTHLDTHRHLHYGVPFVFAIVRDLCRRYDIPHVRRLRERLPRELMATAPPKQRRISRLASLQDWWTRRRAGSLFATEGTFGIAHTGLMDAPLLLRMIEHLPPGTTELMVHPGYAEDLDPLQTRLLGQRRREVEALCDPRVRDALAARGVELVHYGQLR